MGATKYAIEDKDFYLKMRGAASTLMERGTVIILELTGMHVSSLAALTPEVLRKEGDRHYIYWERPKKGKKLSVGTGLRARVPRGDLSVVSEWLEACGGKSTRWYGYVVQVVGERAGYEKISPNTIRHQRAVIEMDRRGPRVAAHRIGTSYKTLEKHYAAWDPEYQDPGDDEE